MAGRPPLEIGTYGEIADPWQTPSGKWQTKARYRGGDGVTRPLTATGDTPAQAKAKLKRKLAERLQGVHGSTGELTRESPLSALVERWLENLEGKRRSKVGSREGSLADDTVDDYIGIARKILIPGLGAVRLRELNTQRCDTYLAGLKTRKRQVRTVLMQVCGLGVRWSLLEYNPVRETESPPRKQGSKRTLTPEDVEELRQRIRDWQDAPQPRGGRPRDSDMAELVDVLMATGERTGEILALWWSDVHGLDDMSKPATITIAGTVDKKGKRQPMPKSVHGYRTLKLPEFGRQALIRQRERGYPFMLVFPSSAGTPRWVNNTNRTWREIRGEEFGWVTPKVFRKTAATAIEREHGAEAAAAQLGHGSPDITRKFYIDRATEAPDNTAALDKFAPKVVNKRSTPPKLRVVGGE
ncbi:integrase family protein [Mycolicibacterium mageritense DSM 44476 = CIP 104973]|uniref:Phage integrase n=1 Tax=Mycolicibacterium mageritense TaxID=53462 RepID=A0ABM7HZD4_MYCME|nr:tyrosine-type recombinase/integrase [Mycolicibacterium mageritense]BBX35986.1 phage integrase [Mycolicibacterium mageritense]CDO24106.1 putative phage integrase [Mycolicibacterium mageritense DSM 44476 = CIP 104973]